MGAMNTNFHTESRMRENCTSGSMRGRAYPITRGVPLYSTPSEFLGMNNEGDVILYDRLIKVLFGGAFRKGILCITVTGT